MRLFHALTDWVQDHGWLVFGTTLGMFVGTLVALPIVVAYLPADYFTRPPTRWPSSLFGWVWHVGKNILGAIFLLMGLAMLVLPGQGLLTILIGVMLIEFPGKKTLELWFIRRRALRRSIDWIRRRSGRPPLDYGNHFDVP